MPEAHELEGVTAVQGAKPVADHVAPLTQDGTVVHVRVVAFHAKAGAEQLQLVWPASVPFR